MPETVPMDKVIDTIGKEAVQKLADSFPGMQLYLPKKGIEFLGQAEKEQYIKNLFYHSAVQISDIAKKVDLSEDRIRKIINKR